MKRSSFIFKESHFFIEEHNPSDKAVTVEELDGIENLADLLKLMFINEECRILKVVADGG